MQDLSVNSSVNNNASVENNNFSLRSTTLKEPGRYLCLEARVLACKRVGHGSTAAIKVYQTGYTIFLRANYCGNSQNHPASSSSSISSAGYWQDWGSQSMFAVACLFCWCCTSSKQQSIQFCNYQHVRVCYRLGSLCCQNAPCAEGCVRQGRFI